MDSKIEELRGQKEELEAQLEKVSEAIRALQELCKHKMESTGIDGHNYTLYECRKCGLQ